MERALFLPSEYNSLKKTQYVMHCVTITYYRITLLFITDDIRPVWSTAIQIIVLLMTSLRLIAVSITVVIAISLRYTTITVIFS